MSHNAKTQQEIIAEAVQKPVGPVRYCGACMQKRHGLGTARGRSISTDSSSDVLCATRLSTTLTNATAVLGKKKRKKPNAQDIWHHTVVRRIGKSPVRSAVDFRIPNPGKWALLDRYPQTCQLASARKKNKILQAVDEQVPDPSWGDPDSTGSQVHPLDAPSAQFPAGAGTFNHIQSQELHSDRPSTPGNNVSYGPTAPDLEVVSASNSPIVQSTAASATMVHGPWIPKPTTLTRHVIHTNK